MPQKIPHEIYFSKGSKRRKGLRARVLRENLIPYVCQECGLGPEWNGKVLALELDHKNGDCCDNSLTNLRFLCGNCHRQTGSYARGGAFAEEAPPDLKRCRECGITLTRIYSESGLCRNCKTNKSPTNKALEAAGGIGSMPSFVRGKTWKELKSLGFDKSRLNKMMCKVYGSGWAERFGVKFHYYWTSRKRFREQVV